MSIALAIARLITPERMLPAPDPACITYDYNESWVMHRNRERYFAESTSQPSPSECLPANVGGGCGSFDPNPPTPEEVAEAARFKYGN